MGRSRAQVLLSVQTTHARLGVGHDSSTSDHGGDLEEVLQVSYRSWAKKRGKKSSVRKKVRSLRGKKERKRRRATLPGISTFRK